jgi:hypothetical protein
MAVVIGHLLIEAIPGAGTHSAGGSREDVDHSAIAVIYARLAVAASPDRRVATMAGPTTSSRDVFIGLLTSRRW